MKNGQVTIDRAARGWLNLARSYRVLINGEAVTRVKYGRTVSVAAAPGHHELQLAVDWTQARSCNSSSPKVRNSGFGVDPMATHCRACSGQSLRQDAASMSNLTL